MGGSAVTGMHVDSVYKLRQALQLDPPGTPVKVIEPYQLLGEIGPDLLDALDVDVVPLSTPVTLMGFRNENWKGWTTFGGTPVLVLRQLTFSSTVIRESKLSILFSVGSAGSLKG